MKALGSLNLKKLVLLNIPKEQSIENLKQRLSAFGPIVKLTLPLELNIQPNKGYAYVHFKQFDSKQKALKATKGIHFENGVLYANDVKPPVTNESGLKHSIFIRGIGIKTNSDSLKSFFEQFGPIDSVDVPLLKKQPYSSLIPKNDGLFYGYIEYKDEKSARAAKLELDGTFLPNSIKSLQLFYTKLDNTK